MEFSPIIKPIKTNFSRLRTRRSSPKVNRARKENMLKKYEITAILKPESTLDDVNAVLGQNGAQIDGTTDLGEKSLIFTINKNDRGHFWSVLFSAEPTALIKIEKALRIKKSVLRFLIISRLKEPIKPEKVKSEKKLTAEETPVVKSAEDKTAKVESTEPAVIEEKPKRPKKPITKEEPIVEKSEPIKPAKPVKKTTKAKKQEEISSEELNKKLEELVKED